MVSIAVDTVSSLAGALTVKIMEFIPLRTNGESNYDSLKVAKKSSFSTALEKPKDRFFLHLSSYASPDRVSSIWTTDSKRQGKRATRIRLTGKRIGPEDWVQGSLSQGLSCFCLLHLYLASQKKRVAASKPGRSKKCVVGSPQLLRTMRGSTPPTV